MAKPLFSKLKARLSRQKLEKNALKAHQLPQSRAQFDDFTQKILDLCGLPPTDNYIQAIAVMIMHVEQTVDEKPIIFFARALRKSIANQVSYEVIDALKVKARELEKQKTIEEATSHLPAGEHGLAESRKEECATTQTREL